MEREAFAAFSALLSEHGVDMSAELSQVRANEAIVADTRFVAIPPAELEANFDRFIDALTKKARAAARRAYEALLQEWHEKGDLGRKARWRDMSDEFKADARYKDLKKLSSEAPVAMFDKFIEELQRK